MMKYKGPGCYRFINEYGKVIYVGSAKNIDRRIHSHWSKSGHLPKECYDSVARVEILKTESYGKALDYEIYFINRYKPKFNKRDKSRNLDSKVVKNDDEYKYLDDKWKLYWKLKELDKDKITQSNIEDKKALLIAAVMFILVLGILIF